VLEEPPWRLSVYPGVGDATIAFVVPLRGDGGDGSESRTDLAANRRRCERRASTELRRFCVQNKLSRLWTFTCRVEEQVRGVDGRRVMVERVEALVRSMREELVGGDAFAYAYVFEECKAGQWHVHMAVGRYFDHGAVGRVWGHGFVFVRDHRSRVSTGLREQARGCASYLAKYCSKGFGRGEALQGQHRYERAQGFGVRCVRRSFMTRHEAYGAALAAFDHEPPSWAWSSSSLEDWRGPPIECMAWG
jgi:hypothetical protein